MRPLTFEPLFMERPWGGRRLAERFAKALPDDVLIGESWELVDRPEAQSVVRDGHELAGRTLGDLWETERGLFGARAHGAPGRFPLLIKLLDCEQTLSVQVHPPPGQDGEPKTEMWVILSATPEAHLFAGLRAGVTRDRFERGLREGEDVTALLHRVEVGAGDVMFLPSGRVHAIGGGNLIAEIQQNSDTTYRVYDFGRPRELHVEQSLRSIDWDDFEPALVEPDGEALVHHGLFEVDRLELDARAPRPAAPAGECAVLIAIDGDVAVAGETHPAGTTILVPATGEASLSGTGTVLRVLLGAG